MKATRLLPLILFSIAFLLFSACEPPKEYDFIIRNAMIYDGSGEPGYKGDLAVNGDSIVAVGKFHAIGKTEWDAEGKALAPGFINMLSWSPETLIRDGRSLSDIRQGVTLEVMGEGSSFGPYNEEMKSYMQENLKDLDIEVSWTTLGEYLQFLEDKGVSTNVASFVGATTLRAYYIGFEDRAPTAEEMQGMKDLARQAMEEGAMGIGSALIYAPAFYAKTDELVELCKVAAEYDGMYITHMRSEGNKFLEAIDEVIEISEQSGIRSEIYHLKAAGKQNWNKLDQAIAKIDSAREAGIILTTNMYTYTAGATGLDAAMPPWVQEGGYNAWANRLKNPGIRKKVIAEMKTDAQDWENLYYSAGSPDNLVLVGFENEELRKYTGKTLAEVAEMRGTSPEETAIDLVIEDGSRVGTVYFLMSEENVKKQTNLPWMSFGSDAGSIAPEGEFLKYNPHPRAYGNFARLLGKYVREEKALTLESAIHKLSALPASNLKIKRRGALKVGNFADLVVFDPDKVQDHATFEDPHQLSTGVSDVWVNGVQVLKDEAHTGATPGKFVKGPGAINP
ncbi:MAG: D-aminoacylase [Bacteroidia bacterium]|nr:D-aminoacylase [Bacteroidia bacterium]